MRNKPQRSFFSKGVVFSIFLHLVLIAFILFWGIGNQNETPSGPIEVSLSTGDFGGGGSGGVNNKKISKKVEKKAEEKKVEKGEEIEKKIEQKKVEEKKEVVKKEEPEEVKKEIKEPEKKVVEEKAKEIIEKKIVEKEKIKEEPKKVEIKKKEVAIPEKKTEEKKEVPKKEEPQQEVVKKEESEPVKEEPEKQAEEVVVEKAETKKAADSSREDVLKEMKRNAVLKNLKKGSGNTTEVAKNNTDTTGEGSGLGSNPGNSGGGGNSAINPIVLSNYYDVLSKRVDRVLVFPPNVELDGNYETLVRFWMNENGRVYGVAIHKTSGNNIIDNNCVKAVNSAAPFPSPPIALQSRIKVEPFVIPCSNKG